MGTKSRSGEVKLKLEYPIKWGEDTISEIVFQRPKGKHLKSIGTEVTGETVMTIAGKISGHPPSFFDEMDVIDWTRVGEVIGDFLDSGRKTGASDK